MSQTAAPPTKWIRYRHKDKNIVNGLYIRIDPLDLPAPYKVRVRADAGLEELSQQVGDLRTYAQMIYDKLIAMEDERATDSIAYYAALLTRLIESEARIGHGNLKEAKMKLPPEQVVLMKAKYRRVLSGVLSHLKLVIDLTAGQDILADGARVALGIGKLIKGAIGPAEKWAALVMEEEREGGEVVESEYKIQRRKLIDG